MAQWPDLPTAKRWCGATKDDEDTNEDVTDCLEAAIEWLIAHTIYDRLDEISSNVRMSCKILVSRLYARKQSSLGVAGFGEQGVVRVTKQDVDALEMAGPDWVYGVG